MKFFEFFKNNKKRKRGISILEATIALSIISIVTATAIIISSSSAKIYADALDRYNARVLADNSLASFQYADNLEEYGTALGWANWTGNGFTPIDEEADENYEYNAKYYRITKVIADAEKQTVTAVDFSDKPIYKFTYASENEYNRAVDFLENSEYHNRLGDDPEETLEFTFKIGGKTYKGEITIDTSKRRIKITDGWQTEKGKPAEVYYKDGKFCGKSSYYYYYYSFNTSNGWVKGTQIKSNGSGFSWGGSFWDSTSASTAYDNARTYASGTDLDAEAAAARELLKSAGCTFKVKGNVKTTKVTIVANYSKYTISGTTVDGTTSKTYSGTNKLYQMQSDLASFVEEYNASLIDQKTNYNSDVTVKEPTALSGGSVTRKTSKYNSKIHSYTTTTEYLKKSYNSFEWTTSKTTISSSDWEKAIEYVNSKYPPTVIEETYEGTMVSEAATEYEFIAEERSLSNITAQFGDNLIRIVTPDDVTIALRYVDGTAAFKDELKALNKSQYGEAETNVYSFDTTADVKIKADYKNKTVTYTYGDESETENIDMLSGIINGFSASKDDSKTETEPNSHIQYVENSSRYGTTYQIKKDTRNYLSVSWSTSTGNKIEDSELWDAISSWADRKGYTAESKYSYSGTTKTVKRTVTTGSGYNKKTTTYYLSVKWTTTSTNISSGEGYDYNTIKGWVESGYPPTLTYEEYNGTTPVTLSASYKENSFTYDRGLKERKFESAEEFREAQLDLYNDYIVKESDIVYSFDFYRYFSGINIDYERDVAEFLDSFGDTLFSFALDTGKLDTYDAEEQISNAKTGGVNSFVLGIQNYKYSKDGEEYDCTVNFINNKVTKADDDGNLYYLKKGWWSDSWVTTDTSYGDLDDYFDDYGAYLTQTDSQFNVNIFPLSYLKIVATTETLDDGSEGYFFTFYSNDNQFFRWEFNSYEDYKRAINYYSTNFSIFYGAVSCVYTSEIGNYLLTVNVSFSNSSTQPPVFTAIVAKKDDPEDIAYHLNYKKG